MISADADRVELLHVFRSELKNICYDLHTWSRRINIGIAHHKFFQNVILNGACKFFHRHALFFGGNDVKCKNRKNGTVHRHGNRHLIQRNLVEENLHIEDGVDGNTGFSYVTFHAFVIAVVTAVCGKIEGNRKPHLTCSQVAAVKSIGFLSSRETGILADSPRFHYIHGAVWSTQKRR